MTIYYIDPSLSINGSGTVTDPYNSWASVTWAAGNTYLQKRGTTYSAPSTLLVGASGNAGNPITLGSYFNADGSDDISKPKPILTGPTNVGTVLQTTFRSYVNLYNLNVVNPNTSSGYGVTLYASNNINVVDCDVVAGSTALSCSSASYSGGPTSYNISVLRGSYKSVGLTQPVSAIFISASSAVGQTNLHNNNVTIDSVTIRGTSQSGIMAKAGSGSTDGELINLTIKNCVIDDCGGIGIYTTSDSGSAADFSTPNRQIRNLVVTNNTVTNCGGGGMALQSVGGVCSKNTVSSANTGHPGTTGGIQIIAYNYLCEDNLVFNNSTTSNFDGVGIFLDIQTAFSIPKVGCYNVTVRRNKCYGQIGSVINTLEKYNSKYGPTYPVLPSSGIRLYVAENCKIYSNLCYKNGNGIGLDGGSFNNLVSNNVCSDNYVSGVQIGWSTSKLANSIYNNLITNNCYGILQASEDWVVNESSGNLTLSAATGANVTATSSLGDFLNHSVSYYINETSGTGLALIGAKLSNTQVTVRILSPFTNTTLPFGSWRKVYTSPLTNVGSYNAYFKNNVNYANGLTAGTGDVTTDPKIDSKYRPVSFSPLIGAGVISSYLTDYLNRPFKTPPAIGAYQLGDKKPRAVRY